MNHSNDALIYAIGQNSKRWCWERIYSNSINFLFYTTTIIVKQRVRGGKQQFVFGQKKRNDHLSKFFVRRRNKSLLCTIFIDRLCVCMISFYSSITIFQWLFQKLAMMVHHHLLSLSVCTSLSRYICEFESFEHHTIEQIHLN